MTTAEIILFSIIYVFIHIFTSGVCKILFQSMGFWSKKIGIVLLIIPGISELTFLLIGGFVLANLAAYELSEYLSTSKS